MDIETTRFGNIEIEEQKILSFVDGLPGFEECKRFVLLAAEETGMIHWMQAIDQPEVSLCVLDVFKGIPDYSPDIPNEVFTELSATENDLVVLTVLVVPPSVTDMTTNLVAPILINCQNNMGKQCILDKGDYSTRHRVFSELQELISQEA